MLRAAEGLVRSSVARLLQPAPAPAGSAQDEAQAQVTKKKRRRRRKKAQPQQQSPEGAMVASVTGGAGSTTSVALSDGHVSVPEPRMYDPRWMNVDAVGESPAVLDASPKVTMDDQPAAVLSAGNTIGFPQFMSLVEDNMGAG